MKLTKISIYNKSHNLQHCAIKRNTVFLYIDYNTYQYGIIIVPVKSHEGVVKLTGELTDRNELALLVTIFDYIDDGIIYTNSEYIPECYNKHIATWARNNFQTITNPTFKQVVKTIYSNMKTKAISFRLLGVNNYYSLYEKEVITLTTDKSQEFQPKFNTKNGTRIG